MTRWGKITLAGLGFVGLGSGSMQAKILSLVPVVDEHGKAELNAGALQRYMADSLAWRVRVSAVLNLLIGGDEDNRSASRM